MTATTVPELSPYQALIIEEDETKCCRIVNSPQHIRLIIAYFLVCCSHHADCRLEHFNSLLVSHHPGSGAYFPCPALRRGSCLISKQCNYYSGLVPWQSLKDVLTPTTLTLSLVTMPNKQNLRDSSISTVEGRVSWFYSYGDF